MQRTSSLLWGFIAALVLLLSVIVFYLPGVIRSNSDIERTQEAGISKAVSKSQQLGSALVDVDVESPMVEAARLKFRRESQDILANILEFQDSLISKHVDQWANSSFLGLQEQLAEAEKSYQLGDYKKSLELFTAIETSLRQLANQYEPLLAQHLDNGESLFTARDAIASSAAFQQALAMAPGNTQAIKGAKRAKLLPEVLTHLALAEQYYQQENFPLSLEQAEQALSVDPEYVPAQLQQKQSGQALKEVLFKQKMSLGYKLLEQQKWQQARESFEQAQLVIKNRQEPLDAIAQLVAKREQVTVAKDLFRAREYEKQEQWRQALALYDKLLERDPGLIDPAARRVQVRVRVAIDKQLKGYIDSPLSLTEELSYKKAQQLVKNTRSLAQEGSRLQIELNELTSLLSRMATTQTVEFVSDGFTNVTLFRVSQLGRFTRKTFELKPGKYIAAGGRPGYRDVRVEFTLTGLDKAPKITVQCSETI